MPRRERGLEEEPLFAGARRWSAWRYWPGLLGLSSGLLLWVVVIHEVVMPLGDVLARVQAGVGDRAVTSAGLATATAARSGAGRTSFHPAPSPPPLVRSPRPRAR